MCSITFLINVQFQVVTDEYNKVRFCYFDIHTTGVYSTKICRLPNFLKQLKSVGEKGMK